MSLIKGRGFELFPEKKWNEGAEIMERHTMAFVRKYIPLDSRPISKIRPTDYEGYVVGSDQVWRPAYFREHATDARNAFLFFAKDWQVKRMAYSASFGTDEWEYSKSLTKDIKPLVQKFEFISVREKSGVDLCRQHLGVNAKNTLDPTLLLHKEDYMSLIEKKGIEVKKGKLLVYVLDKNEEKKELIEQIAKEKGLTPIYIGCAEDIFKTAEERTQPPVEEWLAGFRDAEFIVTDSFHGSVFSILFNKPFVVVANQKRGLARFSSLLGQLNLMDHLLVHLSDYNPQNEYSIADETQLILEKLRKESMAVIDKFLLQK